ncbi:MAG: hypothetical protein H6Q65_1125 [Firmicutes bacterium]|nr:hypothetical protein [Bacillota bacterium]
MRRYAPLFLISCFILFTTVLGLTYLSGHADKKIPENGNSITVYTTLPAEQVSLLAQDFERDYKIHVNIVLLSGQDLIARLAAEKDMPQADVVLADQAVLVQLKQLNLLEPCFSEQIDLVSEQFVDADNYWTGVWYDPVIFAANQDFIRTNIVDLRTWNDLIAKEDGPKIRLGITDFMTADASATVLHMMAALKGETETLAFFKKIHPQIVQYAKFLTTPIRMVGFGECDVAIAVQSETIRYINDGFPIKILYPEDGTAFYLTGAALVKKATRQTDSIMLVDWLLQDNAQWTMQKNKYFFVPVNPESRMIKNLAMKNLELWESVPNSSAKEKQKLMDTWVQTIRLAPKETK